MADRKKSQIEKFREAARQLGAGADEAKFNEVLGKVARAAPPDPTKVAKMRDEIAQAVAKQPPHPKRPRR